MFHMIVPGLSSGDFFCSDFEEEKKIEQEK